MQWYALRSKPNKEMPLWRELSARGLESYYPHLCVKPANYRSRTTRPYFPGYLFLHANLDCVGLSTLQWMPFSLGLVCFGGEPASVPDGMLHAIRRRVDEINAAGGEQLDGLQPGDPVRIQGGPFEGYQAIFDARLPGTERVRVFLQLLRVRQMKLELPANQIQKIKQR